MAKSYKTSRYPFQYWDLFKRVAGGEEVKIPCPDKKTAEALRFDMYGFRMALEKEGHEESVAAQQIQFGIELSLNGAGYDLVLCSVLDSKFGSLVEAALAGACQSSERSEMLLPQSTGGGSEGGAPAEMVEAPLTVLEEDSEYEDEAGDVLAGLGYSVGGPKK